MSSRPVDERTEEYWDWFAGALFVLVTADVITTHHAAWYVGSAAEANPLVRWALGQGLPTVVAVNLLAAVLAVGGFSLLLRLLEATRAPYDRYFAIGLEAWLGLLIAGGLFVFANNVFVIVHGRSLIPVG